MEMTNQQPLPARGRGTRTFALALALALATLVAVDALAEGRGVVNINTANAAELALLPGIGESKASAIVSTRKARGGFQSVDDLLAVKGIGEAALEKIRGHVVLKGATTLKE